MILLQTRILDTVLRIGATFAEDKNLGREVLSPRRFSSSAKVAPMRRTVPRILFWRRITPVSDVLLHADPVVPVVSSIDGPTIDGEVRLAKKHRRRPRK